jgi:hypothetical protein
MSIIHLGTHLKTKQSIALPINKLSKHVAILGMTGSGKTGELILIQEQVMDAGIPTILVDIKGDMTNVALQPQEVRQRMNFRVLTPGGTHGEQINLFANLQKPERVQNTVSQLLKMIRAKDHNPLSSRQHSFLSKLLHEYHSKGVHIDLSGLISGVLDPPFESFGALSLREGFPVPSRIALAAKINNLLVAPSFEKWRDGIDLDVDELLLQHSPDSGLPTNVTVYSVSHLNDEDERLFALALLFDGIAEWMRRQRGTKNLRAMLFVDECAGLLPPYPNKPATKPALITMLKQARAYGLGLCLSSQNPMDLDYKALGNCETWIVGRLQTTNDRRRIIEAITTVTSHDRSRLEARIGNLVPRSFVLCRPNSTVDFRSADVRGQLLGPMTPMEISTTVGAYNDEVAQLLEAYNSVE